MGWIICAARITRLYDPSAVTAFLLLFRKRKPSQRTTVIARAAVVIRLIVRLGGEPSLPRSLSLARFLPPFLVSNGIYSSTSTSFFVIVLSQTNRLPLDVRQCQMSRLFQQTLPLQIQWRIPKFSAVLAKCPGTSLPSMVPPPNAANAAIGKRLLPMQDRTKIQTHRK